MDVRMKKVLLYISIGLLLLAIPAGVFYLGQQKDVRTKAAPATTLSLTPAVQTVAVGDNLKLNVDIDPGSNQVISADIYLTYDPTKLEAKTITNGSSAPRVLNSGIIENGTASIKVGAASNTQPITARGTIAVVTFTAKDATSNFTPTTVQFASNTFVGGLNEPTANVLVGTAPAKITITSGTPTLTPTLIPTVTPTATPASPTGGLTPTLTPTIAASGSAEASASALQILTPEENASITTSQPVIQGTAPPGSTVTIVIHSDTTQTVTVTTNASGNWVFTPTTPLEPGPHTIVVSALTASGATQTTTLTFVVAGAGEAGASESAIPISGTIQTTLLFVGLAILLMTSGLLIPVCF
jgi:large repetitive protein